MEHRIESRSKRNFVLQQGLQDPPPRACGGQFAALHFQPRVVGAIVVQAFLVVAVGALVFGRFCFGSFVYYLLRGQGEFARRTVPWGRGA